MYKVNNDNKKVINIWNAVLEKLQTELDVNAYSTFFLPLIPKDITDETFVLEAPSRFVKEVVSSDRFIQMIENSLKEITSNNYIVEVKEKNEFEKVPTKSPIVNKKSVDSNLNKNFTFDNFVTGSCNRECYEASLAVAQDPGQNYNPLFIYGRAGIGKTHLLHSIGNYCKEKQNENLNVYYTTANDFIDEFMRSTQNKDIDSMKAKFKSIDILLLDDVQFLAGKDKTGEVFFQIFNNLFNEKKQIVLTSDRNPNDLKGLEIRLVSRFASGLTVGMNAPEYDTAKAILKRKIDAKNFDLSNIDDDVLTFIAQNYSTDVRQLEGALTRLFFYVKTINKCNVITLPIAMEALKNITPPKKQGSVITPNEIKKTVCEYYSITIQQITGNSRVSSISVPRSIAIYLCRTLLNMTYEDIGEEFGNRSHATVMSAYTNVEKMLEEDQAYKLVINKIQQLLTK